MKFIISVLIGFAVGVWFAPSLYAFKDKAQRTVTETHIQLPHE